MLRACSAYNHIPTTFLKTAQTLREGGVFYCKFELIPDLGNVCVVEPAGAPEQLCTDIVSDSAAVLPVL